MRREIENIKSEVLLETQAGECISHCIRFPMNMRNGGLMDICELVPAIKDNGRHTMSNRHRLFREQN